MGKYYVEFEHFKRMYDSLMQHIYDEERRYENKIKYIDSPRDWDKETTKKYYLLRLENARILCNIYSFIVCNHLDNISLYN